MKGPETLLTSKILKALRALDGSWWVKIPGGRFKSGLPDIIGCWHGRFIALEVKSPQTGYAPTELQLHVIGLIRAAGGTAGVVYSVEEALEVVHE